MASLSYAHRSLDLLRCAFESSLGPDSQCVEPPPNTLTVSLRSHQQAVLYQMERLERQLLHGMDCSGETFYSSYGILGDSVGVGKSLMIMGHIARLAQIPPLEKQRILSSHSNGCTFSVREQTFIDASEAGCLLVVPHTLFRQWADYIKKQSRLRAIFLEKKKALTAENFAQDVRAAELVLVSNTLYRDFAWKLIDYGVMLEPDSREPWFLCEAHADVDLGWLEDMATRFGVPSFKIVCDSGKG